MTVEASATPISNSGCCSPKARTRFPRTMIAPSTICASFATRMPCLTAPTPTIKAPRTIVVDPADGNQALKAAFSRARGGDLIRIKNGTYFGSFELRNKDSDANKPIWIRAENPGGVVFSNLWQAAFEGRVNWQHVGRGVFKARSPSQSGPPNQRGPFMGSYVDGQGTERFLFRYRSKDAITRNPLHVEQNAQPDMDVKNPAYGFAVQGDEIFIRLKGGDDPNDRSIRLTRDFGKHLLTINRSRHMIVDGIKFEGSGKLDAIICTPKGEPKASSHLTIRNCIFEHCRRAAVLHNHAHVEWSEYCYPGFRDWMNELQKMNDQPGAIFALVKNHFNDHPNNRGNAFLEGGWADNMGATPANCVFEYNFTNSVFEGHRLGAHKDSTIRFEAADGIGDDWVEFEHHQKRSSKNNRVIACKVLNCHGVVCFGAGQEQPDLGPQLRLEMHLRQHRPSPGPPTLRNQESGPKERCLQIVCLQQFRSKSRRQESWLWSSEFFLVGQHGQASQPQPASAGEQSRGVRSGQAHQWRRQSEAPRSRTIS